MTGDARGWRIALLADALLNPGPDAAANGLDVLGLLQARGYGLLALPPAGKHPLLLAVISEQVAEYARNGYALVAIGTRRPAGHGLHWRGMLALLESRGVAAPPRHLVDTDGDSARQARKLAAFLDARAAPAAVAPAAPRAQ